MNIGGWGDGEDRFVPRGFADGITITLACHGENKTQWGGSRYAHLNRNYTFVKHMMSEMGVDKSDYLILRDIDDTHTLDIRLRKEQEHLTSMILLVWPKYETARIESNL